MLQNQPNTKWMAFSRHWLANMRGLRRDTNYCRLALAMRRVDDGRLSMGEYLTLAARWKLAHDEMSRPALQCRVKALEGKGWAIAVDDCGLWRAEAAGIRVTMYGSLTELLAWVERSGQQLREEWAQMGLRVKGEAVASAKKP